MTPPLSLTELGQAYRQGTTTPRQVVEELLERIHKLNPLLNAFVSLAPQALDEAQRAEQELRAGLDRGTLHGIPIGVKDNIEVAGLPLTGGSRRLLLHPQQDAPLVAALRQRGAIVLGKTHLLEFAYGETHPELGATRHPWDPRRTSGGSSGGSAAAVAAHLVSLALGTDTGGSVRIPAAYCGVFGYKPSYTLWSREGILPLSDSLDHPGLLSLSAAEAIQVVEALGGPQVSPPRLRELRLALPQEHWEGLEPEVEQATQEFLDALREAGASLYPISLPSLKEAVPRLLDLIAPEASLVHQQWLETSTKGYAPGTLRLLRKGFEVPAVVYLAAQRWRQQLTRELLEVLQTHDALLSPTVGWLAPVEDPSLDDPRGAEEAYRTAPYNLTGLPAASLPLATSTFPAGLQVAGATDQGVLGVALVLEELRGPFPFKEVI
jgi:aspartyl-tRNA(Asn)/glutamyl-tRNA(Gln) amidotransferase subunit A